jgi:hypothetical protein
MGFFSRFGKVADQINAFGIAHPKATSAVLLGTAGLAFGAGGYQMYQHHRKAAAMRKFNSMWANAHGTLEDSQGRVRAAY